MKLVVDQSVLRGPDPKLLDHLSRLWIDKHWIFHAEADKKNFSECSVFASHLSCVSPVYLVLIEWCEKDISSPIQILG